MPLFKKIDRGSRENVGNLKSERCVLGVMYFSKGNLMRAGYGMICGNHLSGGLNTVYVGSGQSPDS